MVEFFAPWCPACKALQPIWRDFASWSDDLGISVGQVDVTSSPGLSGRFMVTALPTIYHVKNGVFRQYRGSRDKDEFMSFIEERRWESLEEVPAWKSPASMQMSIVSQFFKLSMVLRGVHSVLVEEYGLPTWGSYLVFALATILVGALLGLVLVCIIDFVFPPKPPGTPVVTSTGEQILDDAEEDLVEDSTVAEDSQAEDSESGRVDSAAAADTEEEAEVSQDEDSQAEEDTQDTQSSPKASPGGGVRKRKPRKAD